jgi:antitoxin Phd
VEEIQLKDAQNSLSAVVDRAVAGDQIVITRHGKREAVLISWENSSAFPMFQASDGS